MKDLARIVEQLERIQRDLSMVNADWPRDAARTIRRATSDISDAKAELRKLLTGWQRP